MRWRAFVAAALSAGALAGCVSDPPPYVGYGFKPLDPNEGVVRTTRSQKPDGQPAQLTPLKSLLDMPPEQLGDPNLVQVCASIRAVVNGKAILNEEVREACLVQLQKLQYETISAEERAAKQKQILINALDLLVERELLVQDAYARLKSPQGKQFLEKMRDVAHKDFDRWLRGLKSGLKLNSDEDVKGWLAAQGLSIEGMRKQKEKQLIAEEYLRQMVIPIVDRIGHEHIVEYYRGHPEEFQVTESIKWQDLLIDVSRYSSREEARQVAQQVSRRIQMKEDFLKLAELYNPQAFQFTHGDGYGQKRGEIQPREAEPVLFGMRDGDVNIVELPTGFHVVRMFKHTYAGRMPLDDKLQAQIRDKLRNEAGIREQKRFLAHLKANATIEYSSLVPGQKAAILKQ
jgi:hypothetical protein